MALTTSPLASPELTQDKILSKIKAQQLLNQVVPFCVLFLAALKLKNKQTSAA